MRTSCPRCCSSRPTAAQGSTSPRLPCIASANLIDGGPNYRWRLRIQPCEPTISVVFDAGRAPDLAPCGRGNRTRRYQHEVRNVQAVRSRYRRGDFTLDHAERFRRLLVGVPAALDL